MKNENAKKISYALPVTSVKVFDDNPIYLNVDGQIINGCDWSYDNEKTHILCNVEDIEKFNYYKQNNN